MTDMVKIKELEAKIADLKGRLPKHSLRPAMLRELEELEDELEKMRENDKRTGGYP